MTPEDKARAEIDKQLGAAGWDVQDYRQLNISAKLGVAVREFPLSTGEADYMLYVDGRAAGVIEAKPEGRRAARLGQSILKKAFAGQLVPQDPTDEPASALLERIKASQSAHEPSGKAARPKRRATRT